jgi:TRAP transporter 4TM/12TM fusion protein
MNQETGNNPLITLDQTTDAGDQNIVKQIMEQYDSESAIRSLKGVADKIVKFIAIAMSLFHLYTSAFGLFPAIQHRAVHLAFVFPMVFLLYPASKKKLNSNSSVLDWVLAVLSIIGTGYVVVEYNRMVLRGGSPNKLDIVLAILTTILILEGVRRSLGKALVIIPAVFLIYAYFGQYMPGVFMHKGVSLSRLVNHMYMITEGIFGVALGTSATYIALFVIFSAFLEKSGLGSLINDLGLALTGWSVGGPAKMSVVTSALFGTISGSAVSNVVTDGVFTIPLMKRTGFPAVFSAAVEAVTSTGGQLMPPIMGAAAFIMADTLGVPYVEVAKAAIFPVVLYYSSLFIMVHLRARKLGLKGIPRNQLPRVRDVLKDKGHLMIPFFAVIIMLMLGFTPLFAGSWGIVLVIAVAACKKNTRMSFKDIIWSLETGAKRTLSVGICCASVGLIVGVFTLTGLSTVIGTYIIRLAQGNLILTLVFVMIVSLILGLGLPTVASYMLLASVAVPILAHLGINLMAAHFFIFYFGLMAGLTPPEALTSFSAASIAKANPNRVAWESLKLAAGGYLIPYTFVMSPQLLMVGSYSGFNIIFTFLSAFLGISMLAIAMEGFLFMPLKKWQRILILAGALALIYPGFLTDLFGCAIIILNIYVQRVRMRKETMAV